MQKGDSVFIDLQANEIRNTSVYRDVANELLTARENVRMQIVLFSSYTIALMLITLMVFKVNGDWNKLVRKLNETRKKKLKIYENGYIYLQSTSSMVPPCVLDPNPGEIILDLTAAPGSKTTQIAAMMNNDGYILANELDKIRCERLKFNVSKFCGWLLISPFS